MAVAMVEAADAVHIISGIAHEELLALLALLSDRVVFALAANIKFIGPSTVRVPVAQALDRAIVADVSEIAFANAWLDAFAVHTAKRANRETSAVLRFVISVGAFATKSILEIDALLSFDVAGVVLIQALIFGWTSEKVPRK